jgi:CheY-like chemotaxis protein
MAKSVLIVDDSEDDEILCKLVLRKVVANRMLAVRDGVQAIAYLSGEGEFSDREKFPVPDVLLLDLKMPKVDGFGVLEWLKTQSGLKLLIVVLTHSGLSKDMTRAYELGAHTFLSKPLRHEDVVNLTKHFQGYWEQRP